MERDISFVTRQQEAERKKTVAEMEEKIAEGRAFRPITLIHVVFLGTLFMLLRHMFNSVLPLMFLDNIDRHDEGVSC